VAVGVGLAVGVGVGVGDACTHVAVNAWPELTGGLSPPVGSHPYRVKVVLSFFTPTTNSPLCPPLPPASISPYMYWKGGFPFSCKAIS
jgi:hypothetical protein